MSLRLTRFEYDELLRRRRSGIKEPPRRARGGQRWEDEFAAQLDDAGFVYEREYRFLKDRRFRFDFAFPGQLVAVEIDGAVHRIDNRFRSDRKKFQLALTHGWRALRVGSEQVRNGEALALVKLLLG